MKKTGFEDKSWMEKLMSFLWGCVVLTGFIIVVCVLASCTHTKDLQKTDTKIKTDSVVNTVSVTTITETTIGEVTVKSDTLTKTEPDIIEHPIEIENDNIKLEVTENKITHKITAMAIQKPRIVPVKTVKVTENKTVTKEEVKRNEEKKESTLHKDVKGVNWTMIIAIPVSIVTVAFLFIVWRKRKQITQAIDEVKKIV